MNHSNIIIPLALILIFPTLIGGCQWPSGSQTPQNEMPAVKPEITGDCIVSYFQKDRAPYITQQQQLFNPSSGYLKIIATEPTGIYTFSLMQGQFAETKKPTPFLSALPASFMNESLATAVFYSFCAGAEQLDIAQWTTAENVKIEGQWYQPISLATPQNNTDITLYRNISSNRIELVKATDATAETQWLLQSYNLIYNKDLNVLVPHEIDVFDIQNGLASKRLIIQFDYKNIRK